MSEELADYFAGHFNDFRKICGSVGVGLGLTPQEVNECLQETWINARKEESFNKNYNYGVVMSLERKKQIFLTRTFKNKCKDLLRRK
jgi:hypothetical protein